MKTKISILFHLKRSKAKAYGPIPIYMRVTIDGKRLEISTKRSVEESNWNLSAGRVKGTSEGPKAINAYLDILKKQIYDYQMELILRGQVVNAETMRNRIFGLEEKMLSLVNIFEEHNRKIKTLIGKEFAAGTLERYKTSLKHTVDFLKWKYNVSDIDVRKVDHAFITEYEFYLRSERKCANNSAVKYIKNFGKIIRICLANGWIDKNPFANYKATVREVDRIFLTEDELQVISDKQFPTMRLGQIRDIFLFCCYTGLAYADVKKLDRSQLVKGIDGDDWITTNRQKTDTRSSIPLLPPAKFFLDKYKDHPQCINQDRLLPVLSNQKMNAYLKEIADVCGISKEFTFHTARHTFATTVTLSNGVPIESVSKMLGHKDLKITQHYAKIVDRKVSDDMRILKEKFKLRSDALVKSGT